MRRTVAEQIQLPEWAGSAEKPSRWRCLDELDRHLDGCFYDHLPHSFYREEDGVGGRLIPLERRRPSSRTNWPDMISTWSARKLWAGRHVPKITHSSDEVTKLVDQLVQTTKFYSVMEEATIRGSVGSVAITFRIDSTLQEPQVGFCVWRARDCTPKFDDFRNLVSMRLHRWTLGRALLEDGFSLDNRGEPIRPDETYWWTRLFGPRDEWTLVPIRKDDWNPVQGWTYPEGRDIPARPPIIHDLGFVPGVWIRNLPPSWGVDGKGTWCKAVDNVVEADYLLSQISRGTRYNCSPELVIVGNLRNADSFERSPASFLNLEPSTKQPEGETVGEGKAYLLEMTGQGVKAAQDQIDKLRNMTLESVGATRKDPEKLKGVMSGRAMEFLDEDSHDLVMDLRSSYGDGALELFRKVVRALGASGDPKGLKLEWPRLYQPTPEDLAHLIPALVLAATPIQEPLEPEEAAKISGGSGGADSGISTKEEGGQQVKEEKTVTHKGAGGASHTVKQATTKGPAAAGGRPSVTPTGGKILGSLLEIEEASAYLKNMMDIDLLPNAEEAGVADSDEPTATMPAPEATEEVGDEDRDLLAIPESP